VRRDLVLLLDPTSFLLRTKSPEFPLFPIFGVQRHHEQIHQIDEALEDVKAWAVLGALEMRGVGQYSGDAVERSLGNAWGGTRVALKR
jgi:hypothetical protein